jgi:transcriptional regulator with XRE-family HTH domain
MNDSPLLDLDDLGRRLRAARLVAGLTPDDVAAELGKLGHEITKRTVNAYERGDWMVPLDVFFALAVILHPDQGLRHFTAALSPTLRERWNDTFGEQY